MTKSEARLFQKKRIAEMQGREKKEKQIRKILVERICSLKTIIGYRSDKWEVDLDFLLSLSDLRKIDFYFPRVVSKEIKELEFVRPRSWLIGSYGLLEPVGEDLIKPEDADLSLIPALGFQGQGFRLGRGAGFYDRSHSGIDSKKMLGIGFSELFSVDFPSNDYDIRVGEIVTENKVIFF